MPARRRRYSAENCNLFNRLVPSHSRGLGFYEGGYVKFKILIFIVAVIAVFSAAAFAAEEETKETATEKTSHNRVVLYPVLFQVPLYGAEVDLPSVPGGGGGGGEGDAVSQSTDVSWDSAVLAGISIEREKWLFDFEGEYAGLSAERQRPLLKVNTKIYYFNITGGWKFYRDFAVTGGVKRLAINIHAELADGREARTKPGVWDPMIGVDWRHFVTKRLQLDAAIEGGGFGVGTDVDVSGGFHADWEFAPHVVLNLGYSFLYFKDTVAKVAIGSFEREFVTKQTMHGPRVGLGISF